MSKMEKFQKQKGQKSILDFFKKGNISLQGDSKTTAESHSLGNLKQSPRKRKRAISQKVKKVINSNKKKKIEMISVDDESDVENEESLYKLDRYSFVENNDVKELLKDWNTPEKVANEKLFEMDIKEETSSLFNNEGNNEDPKILNENTLLESVTDSLQSSESMSSYHISLSSPRIISPERTPTPSSCQSSNSTRVSPYIRSSPGKFNFKNVISSPISTSHLNKSVENNNTLANSSSYENGVKRKLCLEPECLLTEGSPTDLNNLDEISSSSKYRGTNGLYLDNFNFILNCIISSSHDSHLFNDDDHKIITNFQTLSLEAKKFYVRLFQRKVRWLQFFKIYYADICEKEDTYIYLNELTYSEFLKSESELGEISVVLNILGKKEIQQLCKDFKVKQIGTRENMINNLIENSKKQKTILSSFGKKDQGSLLLERAKVLVGRCCTLNKESRNVFMRIMTLFSLPSPGDDEESGQQSQLKILLMQKLGRLEFPSYEVIRSCSIFSNRESLIHFTKCYQLDCSARDSIEEKDWEKVVTICIEANVILRELQQPALIEYDATLPSFLRRFTSISMLLYIQSYLIDALQKLKRYEEAVKGLEFLLQNKIHLQDCRGRWYDRLALNYEQHLKNPEKALTVIVEALADPDVMVGHRLALSQRAERIIKSKKGNQYEDKFKGQLTIIEVKEAPKVVIQANSLSSDTPGFKRIYISKDEESSSTEDTSIISSVEEFVLSHYKKQGYKHGLHGEGQTIRVIFGLLFWDCIYSPVADTFLSNYQGAPLDLNSQHFYEARKDIIDKRLSNIRQMSMEAVYKEVENLWNENEGKVCVVNWSVFKDLQHLKGLLLCLGIELIAAMCERLCKNHRFTRSGFPDIIVWNVSEKTSRIVEVKGPNDKLSTKQMLWLEFLINNGATAEVCHVEARGVRRIV